MTKNRLPRISAALLAGAFAVVPVAASIALAPSAAAIEVVDGEEPGFDAEALEDKGIVPLSLDVDGDEDGAESDVEFRDEDGNLVDRSDEDMDLDRSELNRRGIDPLSEDAETADEVDAEPVSPEIVPISANIDQGLGTGAVVAIAVGGVAVVGGGVALGLRARRAKA